MIRIVRCHDGIEAIARVHLGSPSSFFLWLESKSDQGSFIPSAALGAATAGLLRRVGLAVGPVFFTRTCVGWQLSGWCMAVSLLLDVCPGVVASTDISPTLPFVRWDCVNGDTWSFDILSDMLNWPISTSG